jgi:STE24 endopeptidase
MANEDKATRYHRLRRSTAAAAGVSLVLVLTVLLGSGGSAVLRTWAQGLVPSAPWLAVLVYAWVVAGLVELVRLPFAFHLEVTLERRYGLSTQSVPGWLIDTVKGALLGACLVGAAALLVSTLLRSFPTYWWLAATACFALAAIVLAGVAPVLLLPLFYRITPIARPELRDRLMALAGRAGAPALGVFEWKLGERTRRANAALTGLGRTVRILVSDTLLAAHPDDEIEVILAHELAHYVHRDLWAALAAEGTLIVAACFAGDRALAASASVGAFGLLGKADIAGLPVLVLTGVVLQLLGLPAANALSRMHERRADRFALALTRNVPAFVSAMRRLSARNLSDERPSRLVEVLFLTHPTCASRIDAARTWESAQSRSG